MKEIWAVVYTYPEAKLEIVETHEDEKTARDVALYLNNGFREHATDSSFYEEVRCPLPKSMQTA